MQNVNVSVGDIFTNSDEIYRVLALQYAEDFPDDPYLEVELFVSGSGFVRENLGFTILQAQEQFKLQHYKLV